MFNDSIESFPCPGIPNEGGGVVICCANGKTASDRSRLVCNPTLFEKCQKLKERKVRGPQSRCSMRGASREQLERAQIQQNNGDNEWYIHRPARVQRNFAGDLHVLPTVTGPSRERLDEKLDESIS